MCGLFGITPFENRRIDLCRKAINSLIHRGPDQWGEWYDNNIYIGHRRLSILDLSEHGRQPMCDDVGSVVIGINGEIYNFKELKHELERDYQFNSTSDSEVVLHGYRSWGIDELLRRMDGMYAFYIYDKQKSKIYLGRDRVGIKPIYYAVMPQSIAWASELKALEVYYETHQLVYDETSLYDFLTYLYIPTPKTFYKNIYKLEPAHYLVVDVNTRQIQKNRYWTLNTSMQNIKLEDAARVLRTLVQKSVKEQIVSDVPIGFFLSGGMDSSSVVAEASSIGPAISAYSIGFDREEHDETHYAEIVAKHFKVNHTKQKLDESLAMDLFCNMKNWYDEPFADTSAIPTYLVAKLARRESTVVLTGDGGDEILGGYNWYNKFRNIAPYRMCSAIKLKEFLYRVCATSGSGRTKRVIRRALLHMADDYELYTRLMGGMHKSEKRRYAEIMGIPRDYDDYWYFRKHYRQDLPLLTRLQYLDFHTYLPDDILTKVDRATMAVSLEARVPLLSTELVEFCFSLPEAVRYVDGQLKGIMKYAYSGILPVDIIFRDKKGFSIPFMQWKMLRDSATYHTKQEMILDAWQIQ